MVEIAKKHQESLVRIKKNVERAYQYFKSNYNRYHEFRKMIFVTSLTKDDRDVLAMLKKPELEFNVLEAYLSRLKGEFSKQEPSIEVSSEYGAQIDQETLQTLEDHFRHMEYEARLNGCASNIYNDQLSGGFGVHKVWTEYANEKSFDQIIKWERVRDPSLIFFDPLAMQTHKADSRYWGEIFPKSKAEFEEEYPDIDITNIKFTRDGAGSFNWSYKTQNEDILLITDYYEKKKKRKKIVKLASNQTMTMDEYNSFLEQWKALAFIEQPPAIIDERMSEVETICRYRFIEDQVIEYVETDFKYPNYIFVDGNSILYKDLENGQIQQYTRPYVYQAKDIQRLKNFAGQTLANELENMIQHKIMIAKQGIPDGYESVYKNVQLASTLVYNPFKDEDPNIPLPPPQIIARTQIPTEIAGTFTAADQTIQNILGSYDASLGINNNQLSGVAIVEAATQSNAAAMPYITSYIQSLNQVAKVILDLIPKYYTTPRTIPILTKDGKKDYKIINNGQGVNLKYSDNSLNVKVEAGVNFNIQKSRNLQQIVAAAQAMPIFAQFMNEKGLHVFVKNLDIKGADQLLPLADQFMQELQQQKQMAQQMQAQAAQNNPVMIKAQNERMNIQREAQKDQVQAQLSAADLALKERELQNEQLDLVLRAHQAQADQLVQLDKHQTEKARTAVDLAINAADMSHRHTRESHELAHKVNMDHLNHELSEKKSVSGL